MASLTSFFHLITTVMIFTCTMNTHALEATNEQEKEDQSADFFNFKNVLPSDDLEFQVKTIRAVRSVTSIAEQRTYPTRKGIASEDTMCDQVYNSVPSDLTFITKYNYYSKYTHAYNIPIVSSSKVSDAALKRACYVVRFMLADRRVLRDNMYKYQGRVAVIGRHERTTQIPEHSFLDPWWDQRSRGLGGTMDVPVSTGGEENLLCERKSLGGNDRYPYEDIFLHEFAHAVHLISVNGGGIPGYQSRLSAAYNKAKNSGLWANTYAMSRIDEYFAEGVQSYFNINKHSDTPNGVHGPISTWEKLQSYDPTLFKLIKEVFPCENKIVKRCEGKEVCKDENAMCSGWVANGECNKNPAYMSANCALSCKLCDIKYTQTKKGTCEIGSLDKELCKSLAVLQGVSFAESSTTAMPAGCVNHKDDGKIYYNKEVASKSSCSTAKMCLCPKKVEFIPFRMDCDGDGKERLVRGDENNVDKDRSIDRSKGSKGSAVFAYLQLIMVTQLMLWVF